MFYIEIENSHNEGKQYGYQDIGNQAAPQGLSGFGETAVSVVTAYNRGQPVTEAGTENDAKGKKIVHERGGAQFGSAVMPYHQRIGKTENDDTQLTYNDRQPQKE